MDDAINKAAESDRNEKTRAKLAVLPPAMPASHFGSNAKQDPTKQDPLPVQGHQAGELPSDPATATDPVATDSTPDVDGSASPVRAPRLQVVGPMQLASHGPDPFQSISTFQHELEEEPRNLFERVATFLSGWATSFIVHTLILIALAVLSISAVEEENASLTLSESTIQELNTDTVDFKVDFSPIETSSASELENEVVSDFADDLEVETLAAEDDFELPIFDAESSTLAGSGLAPKGDGGISGVKGKGVPGKSADFFGAYAEGADFVFIIDCSGSMMGERWDRAVYELERSILDLNEEQNFCIVLYNRFTAIMGDSRKIEMVPRNEDNIELAFQWLRRQVPSGGTYPRQAISLALAEQPDAIFLLSDGEIQDNSEEYLQASNIGIDNGKGEKRQISVHTIALLSTFGQRTLKRIADDNEGTFTRVDR